MVQLSPIEWTDVTWNPVAGCTVATAGCTNCDAMGVEKYAGLTRKSGDRYVWTGKVVQDLKALTAPRSWRTPRTVFVNSMSDLFHDAVETAFISKVWEVMWDTPQHTYQVLTKRPERMQAVLSLPGFPVLPNVWIGTSVEDAAVINRIEHLRATPAAIRFISFEPLIGSVAGADITGIDWAIVGGESGPRARPMPEEWVHAIEGMCRQTGTAFFFKQWGGRNKKAAGRVLNGRTYDEMPRHHIFSESPSRPSL
jgi:protein gp37